MNISRSQVQQVVRAYLQGANPARFQRGPKPSALLHSRGDAVSISGDAQRVQQWVNLAKDLPEIRHDQVARIKEALARGTYDPAPDQVAEKILQRLLVDQLIEEP